MVGAVITSRISVRSSPSCTDQRRSRCSSGTRPTLRLRNGSRRCEKVLRSRLRCFLRLRGSQAQIQFLSAKRARRGQRHGRVRGEAYFCMMRRSRSTLILHRVRGSTKRVRIARRSYSRLVKVRARLSGRMRRPMRRSTTTLLRSLRRVCCLRSERLRRARSLGCQHRRSNSRESAIFSCCFVGQIRSPARSSWACDGRATRHREESLCRVSRRGACGSQNSLHRTATQALF